MDISKLSNTPLNTNNRLLLPSDLFKQLNQLGSIEARVVYIKQGQAILNSQLGRILSANTLDLKTGDRLLLRSGGSEQAPVLKVNKLPPQVISISAAANQKLSQLLPNSKPLAALIAGQKADNTLIQIGDRRISIQAQPDLISGQLISLQKLAGASNIQIRALNHQQVLKSAITQLLPSQANQQQPSAILQLAKLIQGISSAVPGDSKARTSDPLAATISSSLSDPKLTAKSGKANLFSLLETFVYSLPQLSKLDQASIRRWISYLALASPQYSARETTTNPFQLMHQLVKSDATVAQQLQQWAELSKTDASITGNKVSEDLLQQSSREIVKLAEQTVNQQLLQQTNLRYQQELQQPIALNMTIPLTDQQKLQELRLKIRQRISKSDTEKQCWDIHLDFEFGLLGLISTHLLLDDGTLSASFWSSKADTQQKINSNLSDFQEQISRAGFTLGQFHSFPGKKPATVECDELVMPETLLDIRV